MCFSVEGLTRKLFLIVEIAQRPFKIARFNNVAKNELIWGGDLRVGKLKPEIEVHERVCSVKMVLNKQVDVIRMKQLLMLCFLSLVVHFYVGCKYPSCRLSESYFR